MAKYKTKHLTTHNNAKLHVTPGRFKNEHGEFVLMRLRSYPHEQSWVWNSESLCELVSWCRATSPVIGTERAVDFTASNAAGVMLGPPDGRTMRLTFAKHSSNPGGWLWTAKALLELADWLEAEVIPAMEGY